MPEARNDSYTPTVNQSNCLLLHSDVKTVCKLAEPWSTLNAMINCYCRGSSREFSGRRQAAREVCQQQQQQRAHAARRRAVEL